MPFQESSFLCSHCQSPRLFRRAVPSQSKQALEVILPFFIAILAMVFVNEAIGAFLLIGAVIWAVASVIGMVFRRRAIWRCTLCGCHPKE